MALLRTAIACLLLMTLPFASLAEDETGAGEAVSLLQPLKGDHVLGDVNAPVTIIEYASLSCSHCATFHIETFPDLKKQYIDTGKVVFVYRHFPLNDPALRGAMLAECSGDKFHTFLKVMFNTQPKWAYSGDYIEGLRGLANVGGMSNEKFDACMADKALDTRLIENMQAAANELGVSGTPALFINGEMLTGEANFDTLASIIDATLEEKDAQ
ncbi:MAG: DsbA family protein [Rickettsiales bacterium]